MHFAVIGIVALVLYALIARIDDNKGSKKAEGNGFRANRRD